MQPTRFALVAAVGLGVAAPAAPFAQEQPGLRPNAGAPAAAVGSKPAEAASVAREPDAGAAVGAAEAYALPGSLERIKRRMAAVEEPRDGRRLLNLRYYVDVYARAPAIEILRNFDLESETVSYGSPTHLEMLEAATPREWRPRAISTGNLFRWR